jgi:plastocyanin
MHLSRGSMLLAVAAAAVMACGGEQPPAGDPASGNVASTGGVHDVDMVFDGTNYRFVPADLSIKAGDMVRFHNRSGGPHNVAFWEDSIPEGAAQVLQGAMPDQMAPLAGEMVVTPDATYEISFAGALAGVYKYYCLPHLQLGMVAMLTVES